MCVRFEYAHENCKTFPLSDIQIARHNANTHTYTPTHVFFIYVRSITVYMHVYMCVDNGNMK